MSIEMTADQSNGRWADRAAARYDADYARRYRDRDEQLQAVQSNQDLVDWLGGVCDCFDCAIDVLDLGCGTGRYFWGLRHLKSLTGLDASPAMIEEARHPVHADKIGAVPVSLIEGDALSHPFAPASFDLVYSIGVLAEHVPLDRSVIDRVASWLRPGGRFAFTTVHPKSPSVPATLPRRAATAAADVLPARLTSALHRRLVAGGMYADERWITAQLSEHFAVESLERFPTDVHLHGRCVAVKMR